MAQDRLASEIPPDLGLSHIHVDVLDVRIISYIWSMSIVQQLKLVDVHLLVGACIYIVYICMQKPPVGAR